MQTPLCNFAPPQLTATMLHCNVMNRPNSSPRMAANYAAPISERLYGRAYIRITRAREVLEFDPFPGSNENPLAAPS